jgi:hypothetical protein
VRSHAKAATAGSTERQATGLSRFFSGAGAASGTSPSGEGSGAPSRSRFSPAALAGLALCALVALTASVASGAVTTEYVKSFGPDGTEATRFQKVNGVALDQQTGAVYVLDGDAGILHKFDADGQPLDFTGTAAYISGNEITGLAPYLDYNKAQVAVDSTSHVVYVTEQHSIRAFEEDGEAAVFTAGPGVGTSEIPGFGELVGVAVDSNGAIYARDHGGTVSVFASSGESLTSFALPTSGSGNLGLASNGSVYVAEEVSDVQRFVPSEFPVAATTTYTAGVPLEQTFGEFTFGAGVDPVSGDVYVIEGFSSWIKKFDSTGAFVRFFDKPEEDDEVTGTGQGIAVVGGGEEFQFYLGVNGDSGGQVAIFGEEVIEGPPDIASTSAIDVTANSAILRTKVNPNTAETTYRFEYGLEDCAISACMSVPVSGSHIAAGHRLVQVQQDVLGLKAGTTYHYRVVAENSFGVTEGPDHTLMTQVAALGFQLSDSRAWEMVSPPDKHGGLLIGPAIGGVIQASKDGNELAYLSMASIEANPDGNRILEPSTVLGRRDAAGWRSKDITPPNERVGTGSGTAGAEYRLFSSDLDTAVVEPRSGTPLSPQATERTPYLRQNTQPPIYTPLVTGKEGFANVPAGTEFGGGSGPTSSVDLKAASADLKHLGLRSLVPLAAGAPTGQTLYEWSGGQLHPVSVLPAAEGGGMVEARLFGSGLGAVRNAISEDGSRVFWSTGEYGSSGSTTALYMRDTQAEETVRLDVVQPDGSGSDSNSDSGPLFQGASSDGGVVFFTDTVQLTEDASPSSEDLYRCEFPAGAGASGCTTLTNISAPPAGSGENAEVLGVLAGMSDDARTVYFVARGELDQAPNVAGDSAVSGEPNLYAWREGFGVRFIATLSDEDQMDWGGGNGPGRADRLIAAASPGGRYLAFMSERSLTGYDNTDAITGKPLEEVYRYDAVADRLDCVSCNPSGGSPLGEIGADALGARPLVDPLNILMGRALAAALPEAIVMGVAVNPFYRPRGVLDNGRVLFNAIDALVPADSNGEWDVYQYEETGVGNCSTSSGGPAASRSAAGCVSLLSSGTAEEEAGLLDASVSGDDVFFLTSARLSITDEDDELDVYDARVDGVVATLEPSAECLGEACQPAAIVPNDPTPASANFRGPGNLKAGARKRCARNKRAVRRNGKARCVPRKKARRSHRASQDRRAG